MGTTPPTLGSSWTVAPPTSFKVSVGNGLKTVSLFARDVSGNVSAASTQTITLTTPTPTVVIDLKRTWSRSLSVPVGVSTTDPSHTGITGDHLSASSARPTAGQAGWKLVPTSFTFSGADGLKTLYGWVKDGNNTVSDVSSDPVTIDTTRPTCTITVSGSGTPTPSVTVAGADNGSGIAGYALVIGTDVLAANDDLAWHDIAAGAAAALCLSAGTVTVTGFVMDNAGNIWTVDAGSSQSVTMS
jgi:hypothetical protein